MGAVCRAQGAAIKVLPEVHGEQRQGEHQQQIVMQRGQHVAVGQFVQGAQAAAARTKNAGHRI
jgi:hypothetical protein